MDNRADSRFFTTRLRYSRLTYYHLQRGGLLHSGSLFVHRANKRGDLFRFSNIPTNRANEKELPTLWRLYFSFTSYKNEKMEMDVDFQNFPSLFSNTVGKKRLKWVIG